MKCATGLREMQFVEPDNREKVTIRTVENRDFVGVLAISNRAL
jgi:hypothetical protein